ncbi:hypothetical protein LEMLEM_LOCUS2962 [Lemmus lemmus]
MCPPWKPCQDSQALETALRVKQLSKVEKNPISSEEGHAEGWWWCRGICHSPKRLLRSSKERQQTSM